MSEKIYKIEEYQGKWTEGGTYLKCPKCGRLITSNKATIDDIENDIYLLCGKCLGEYIISVKITEFKDYK